MILNLNELLVHQVMHELSQRAISNPCEQLRCSHLCLLAPAVRPRSGAAAAKGATAVCRCPKGMILSLDKITCSMPKESSFILLLTRSVIYQVNVLVLRTWPWLFSRSLIPFPPTTDLSADDASGKCCPEENAHEQTAGHPWGN